MAASLAERLRCAHLVFFQSPKPKMAKVDAERLEFLQTRQKQAKWGGILRRVPRLMNLSDKEFADRIGVTPQQLGNWHAGTENAALWRYHADPDVNDALQWAQAEANGRATVRPVIELPPLKVGT